MAGEAIRTARAEVLTLHLSTPVEDYIIELVEATRRPGMYGNELSDWIAWGASPRGAIAIEHGARALAWLDDRDFITPEDVRDIAPDALRHRVLPGFEAEAEGITATRVIDEILAHVPAP